MNPWLITAIVVGLAIVAFTVFLFFVLWLNHLYAHRDRREDRSLMENIEGLGRVSWFQHLVTLTIGLIAGAALYAGWCADFCR